MTTAYPVGLEYLSRGSLCKRLFLLFLGIFVLSGLFAQEYTLSTSTSGNGSILKDPDLPTYTSGSSVELTADADPGWSFESWSGDLGGSTNPESLTMDGDKAVTANFTQDEYTLTVNIVGNGSVNKGPDQATYHYDDIVSLTAVADAGYTFTGWSGDLGGSANPESLTMDGNKTVTATFAQDEYTLSVNIVGNGTVNKVPDQATYHYDDIVSLTAVADAGYTFTGWSGDLGGSANPESLTMDGNKTVTATFTAIEYSVTISIVGNGTVNKGPDQATYHYDDIVSLTAVADAGYTFTGWSGDLGGSANPESLTMDGDKTVTATFTQDEYTLTVIPVGSGTVDIDPVQATYHYGDEVDLTATADAGWTFDSWSGGGLSGNTNPETVTISGNTSVTATFTRDEYTLTIIPVGSGTVDVDPIQATYHYGDEVDLTATAAPGWTFDSWSGGGLSGNTTPETVTISGNTAVTATFTQDEYTLTVIPVGSGTVDIDPVQATYHYGDEVDLTANADPGWSFGSWSGDLGGSVNPSSVTITGNTSVTATFTRDEYTLTIIPVGSGTVDADPVQATYHYGDEVDLTATAAVGWTFDSWSGGGLSGNTTPETLTIGGNTTVTATFTQIEYTLTINIVGTGAVNAEPLQATYHFGDEVDLLALPAPGWSFDSWSGGGLSGNAISALLTINGNTAVTATFTQDEYTLTVIPVGSGTVDIDPVQATYHYGDEVDLTATAAVGWTFDSWSGGGLSGNTNPETVTISGNTSVTATFTRDEYTLTIIPVGSGTVDVDPVQATYHYGDEVDLTATAAPGWTFDSWSGGGLSGNTNPETVTISGNTAVTATFTQDEYTLTINLSGSGSVAADPLLATYHYGDEVDLTATAAPGWTFDSWSGGGLSGNTNPETVTISGNTSVTATFTRDEYTLTIIPVGSGTVDADPVQATYHYGDEVDLTATAAAGWTFDSWSGGGLSGNANPETLTIGGNTTVTATFTQIEYTLTINIVGTGTVNAEPLQATYHYGDEVDLLALPAPGWSFDSWSGGGLSGNAISALLSINGNTTITATFTQDEYTLTVTPVGSGTVDVDPVQATYHYGDEVDLTATADAGWTFDSWSGGGLSGNTNPETVTISGNTSITATFTRDEYTLTIIPVGSGTVDVDPVQATYHYGDEVDLTATAAPGWTFDSWSGGGLSGNTNPESVTISGNTAVTATFSQDEYTLTINLSGSGSVAADPLLATYHYGDEVDLTATAAPGWTFDSWSGGGLSGTTNPESLTMDGNKTITATFTRDEYTLTINTVGGGTVDADPVMATYHYGDEVDLTATATAGWTFTGWSGDLAGSTNPVSLTMDGDKTVTATFTQLEYTLTINTVGSGTVNVEPLQATYHYGDELDLLAFPAPGWSLDSWSGGGLGGNASAATLTIAGNTIITATFTRDEYTLTINTGGNGSVAPDPDQSTYYYGDEVDLTATAAVGWTFDSWFGGGLSGNANPETVTIVGNTVITATFTRDEYTLTINTEGNGSVSLNPDQSTYYYGDNVDLTANAATGWNFVDWSGDLSGSVNPATLTMDGNKTVTATFQLNTYQLSLQYAPPGASGAVFSPSSPVTFTHGIGQSISVTIPVGYDFEGWTIEAGSAVISDASSPTTTVTLNSGDATLQANFELKTYQLTLSLDGTAGVTFTPSSPMIFQHGISRTISVSVPSGYVFGGWTTLTGNVSIDQQYATTTLVTLYDSDATLVANFVKIVEVTNVSIPNATMRIGDVVSATIEVITDAGIPYTLVSGSIGGYDLYGLQRINSTTYLANFDVTSGGGVYYASQNIPVSNLVLTNGTIQNSPYNLPIIQNNDLLDGQPPVIEEISVVGGMKKIGDEVIINLNTDGSNYSIHPNSRINGKLVGDPDIYFDDLGSGNYRLRYYVQEGDNDVGYGDLEISIILIKPSGNTNSPQTFLENRGGIAIDANRPVISRMEVPSSEFGPDLTLQITVTADGSGYLFGSGTVANGVPLGSSRLNGSEHSGGLYDLSYTISSSDQNVSPGNLQVTAVLIDPAGNSSAPFSTVQSNSLEVYTTRPTAVLAGTPETCSGDPAQLTVFLQGRSPWVFELDDGSEMTRYESVTSNEVSISVSPLQTTTYTISSVWDRNWVGNFNTDDAEVLVNQKTAVEITNLASGYSMAADPVELKANVSGGVFSGPGVISTTGYFYPDIADTINSPHTIKYTYLNANGCISTDSRLVFVLGAQGDIFVPVNPVCADSQPFIINASNVAGSIGSFVLLDEADQAVAGLTDRGNNSATVDPRLLPGGLYTIVYTYFDEVTLVIEENFLVESPASPEITSLSDTYCQNENPVAIITSAPGASVTGPGVTGNLEDGFFFNPMDAKIGNNILTSTITAGNGCSRTVQKVVQVKNAPEIDFEISTACIPIEGGYVQFSNLSGNKLNVSSWQWDFDDIGSGTENQSALVNPNHFYREPGERNISLTATTFDGCSGMYMLDTLIGGMPVAGMTWSSDCFSEENDVEFINVSETGASPLASSIWTFRTIDGQQIGNIANSSEPVSFSFPEMDSYLIDLQVTGMTGCADSVRKELVLRPSIQLGSDPYLEDFNDHDGLWTIHSDNQIESWVWGEPDFDGYVDSLDNKAWYTQLPTSIFDVRENSWLQSPCFDFTQMKRPFVQLDIMRSFVPRVNGAVLQYREGAGENWKTLGSNTPGIHWYNLDNILNRPGGSSKGWGLEVFNPDREWVRARHDLDDLVGKPNITFRVAIATNGSVGIGNEGFAWDNFSIAERSKMTVLEYFTNSSDTSSVSADHLVDAISLSNSGDMIDLQYHTDFPGTDPMNDNNPFPASTRSFYYGVPEVPYAILNGGNSSEFRYDFASMDSALDKGAIKLVSLEIPEFTIDLAVSWNDEALDAAVEVNCMVDEFAENIQLYLVVFESSVTAYTGDNGDNQFRNVVLDMLPSPAGKLLGSEWKLDSTISISYSWPYAEFVENTEDLAVVAFIQDRNSGRIIQSALQQNDETVEIQPVREALPSLHVYPNPVQHNFYINLGRIAENAGIVQMIDMNGRVVLIENVPPGYQIYQMDVSQLDRGVYILQWFEAGQLYGMQKIIKVR